LESSGINFIADFVGKKIMLTNDVLKSASIVTMLRSHGIGGGNTDFVEHNFNLNELIDKKVDIYSAYISNEPFELKQKGIKYKIFSPRDEGFDFYDDILFTSKKNLQNNPHDVQKFRQATLEGWEYAFSHIQESVDLIMRKYNIQNKSREALLYEAEVLKKLAYYKVNKIGTIDKEKIQRIYDVYNILGLVSQPLNLEELIFDCSKVYFTKEEIKYIKNKHFVKYCTQPDSLPYSAIKDGKFIGIGSEILELVSKKTGMEFNLVETSSWQESVQKALHGECSMLPLTVDAPSRRKFFNFTSSFYSEPLVIVTKKEENYILDINSILDKEFAVLKANSFGENLKISYPNIKLNFVDSVKEGLMGVESGKYYGYIDIMMSMAYAMQHYSSLNLKMSGQLNNNVDISFAVRKDDMILYGILDKIAKNITQEDIQKILNKWISVNYTKGFDFWYYREIFALFVLLVLFLLYKENFLKKKNKDLEELQEKLVELNYKLESKIQEANLDLEKAQEIAKLGSWVYDIQNNELRFSKQTYIIFEIDPDGVTDLKESFKNRVHPDDLRRITDLYYESLEKKTKYRISHRIVMDDGSVKHIDVHCETIYDDGLALISYGTVQDITQSVLLEKEMKEKDALMLHQSRLAQMGEMMSMIAHQWKQPLSAISATQITLKAVIELEKYDLSDKHDRENFLNFLKKHLDKIALYVQNLSKVINDFSNFYKPNKDSKQLDLDSVVLKAYELIRDSLISCTIDVDFDLNSKSLITIHENEFIQVVLNILNNAKDQFSQKGIFNAKIHIRTYETDKEVVLEIQDNAEGIEDDVIEYIFDPYFSTKLDKNGTGLGLYMSKMIISEYHNGDISVRNSSDGAIFTIKIKKDKVLDNHELQK
jgi:signal transduction histidine kinase/ABC-type amino acid transport substrate-binding protein